MPQQENTPPARSNTNTVYILAVVVIVAIAVIASAVRPDQTTPILAFCGTIVISLLAIIKGQTEIHEAVNSKMDAMLKTKGEAEHAKGVLEEKLDKS